ncbi:hypothetical protein AMS68_006909 [Peltaster fructicola]|uniref:SUZ domain-containing protein n=1 Tax=Peltaster fructicola TaxID=286661 RepID=A0A6H0Y300_9PEZI|nr:hypothetical protein AMS68_006909 [Peltaster fructicola]
MSGKNTVPSAWDDDWTNVADTKTEPLPAAKLTKAEKRAQHQQLQKEIWSTAESPSRNLWLEAKGAIPLKQDFVPAMTVLSRKPAQQIAKRDASNGVAGLSLEDDDDSETEARKKRESELEERQRKAKLEREEKVRKYAEARERIMGSSAPGTPKVNSDSRELART